MIPTQDRATDFSEATPIPRPEEAARIKAWQQCERALKKLEPLDAALVVKAMAILRGI
jgi:hypothetical protein